MKKPKIAAALAAVLCMILMTVPVMAAGTDAGEPTVTLTMDKDAYKTGEPMTATVEIRNTTSERIKNISVEVEVPEGYQTEDGQTGKAIIQIPGSIAKDKSLKQDVKFVVKPSTAAKPESNNSGNKNGGANTGDPSNLVLWCGLALAGSAVLVLLWKKRKTGIKVLSLLLVVTLTGTMIWMPEFYAKAAETEKNLQTDMSSLISSGGYQLKWNDEFDGTELNKSDWNVETHDPGWVNEELQAYVDSEENIFVKDGKLVLHPIQTKSEDGKYSYTSGRVNTQNKHDYKYGLFVARAKVPTGMGYLPAFWMMPTNENLYGQWPKCGEIDIMEVMGQTTNKAYNTIHFGEPHDQKQGTYTTAADEKDFAADFHEFALEWLPGELIWYVDGVETFRTSDWFSATEGKGTVSYPAPFDQNFYVILNLAVGGSWVGYPDNAAFKSSDYEIDYVRVYQKDSYDDSNVKAPVKEPVFTGTIDDGNYIESGDFTEEVPVEKPVAAEKKFKLNGKEKALSVKISYSFAVNAELKKDPEKGKWTFLEDKNGVASQQIQETADGSGKEIYIQTEKEGDADYSVQLVQPGIPMQKGAKYRVTFDAYADAARTMQTKISAPDHNWAEYWGPVTVALTTQKQTFSYDFQMTADDDANGRLEFNMGHAGSTAGIHISNIKVEKVGYEVIPEDTSKKVLSDGNYIYNGEFQEGEGRTGYWEFETPEGTVISVTNEDPADRRLKIVAPAGTSENTPVKIFQNEISLENGKYAFSFTAQGPKGSSIVVTVAGKTFTETLDGTKQTFTEKFELGQTAAKAAAAGQSVEFKITSAGTYYLDDIRLEEDALIKNGSFNAGFTGYQPYVEGSASASYVVDSQKEDHAANFGISDTGDADWKIQLKQNNVEMEEGQWYRLSFKAKSTLDRKLMYAIQRDGSTHKTPEGGEDWTPYCQNTVDLTGEWQTITREFQMKEPDDAGSILSISMGAVGGKQIKEKHDIYIDDILLEKIPPQEEPVIPPTEAGVNLLKNADFAEKDANWDVDGKDNKCTATFDNKKAVFDIWDVGTDDWDVKLRYKDYITLEAGATYKVKFKATSTEGRTIKLSMMNPEYAWYGGEDIELEKDQELSFERTYTIGNDEDGKPLPTCDQITFAISMGKIGETTPTSVITLSDFSLEKVSGGESDNPGGSTDPSDPTVSAENMLKNADFSKGEESWEVVTASSAVADPSFDSTNKKVVYQITNVGEDEWHIQLKQSGLSLKKGAKYSLKFKANSTETRKIKWAFNKGDAYIQGGEFDLNANKTEECKDEAITFTGEDNANVTFVVSMGLMFQYDANARTPINTPVSTITLSDFELVEVK